MPSQPIKVISAALHMSILIYIGVVFYLANTGGWTTGWMIRPENRILFYVLTGVAMTTGFLSLLAPRLFKDTQSQAATSGSVEPLFFDFSEKVTPRMQSLTVMRMALAESVAIFGLVLAFLNQSAIVVLPYALAGLVLQILVGGFGSVLRGK